MSDESRVLGDMERAKRLDSMPSHLGLVDKALPNPRTHGAMLNKNVNNF